MPIDPESWLSSLDSDARPTEEDWHARLTEAQFRVLRMKGTEEIHTGEYNEHFEEGAYACSGCSQVGVALHAQKCRSPLLSFVSLHSPPFDRSQLLYASSHKFKSGHGWPAFFDNYPGALDRHGKGKVEITCCGCGGHIGHVFKSSRYPKPTNERHCTNSVSLRFIPAAELSVSPTGGVADVAAVAPPAESSAAGGALAAAG